MAAPRPRLSPALWARAKEVFARVLGKPPARREAAARRACRGDAALEAEVLSLLGHHASAGGFLRRVERHPLRNLFPTSVRGRIADGARPLLRPGSVVAGRYEVEGPLGRGGFGTVARARDRLRDHPVALKVVPAADEAAGSAWRSEVATLRRARLPGVASLLDDGREGDTAFVVMELVEGRPFPGRRGRLPWSRLADPAASFLEALARLHSLRVVHRDLKPANVLVDASGVPVIVDLGAAVDRSSPAGFDGSLVGTPGYLAPEILGGGTPDERSDLYAAGVLFRRSLRGPAPRAVRSLLDALVRPDPRDRPASAGEAAAVLRGEATGGPVERVLRAHGAAPPGPRLKEADLRRLFAGPDVIFHLREDAARALHGRTRGDREAVERTLRTWTGAGLARREGNLFVIDRGGLARIPRLDGRGDASLSPASPGFPRRALRASRAAFDDGRPLDALALAGEGLDALRRSGAKNLALVERFALALVAFATGCGTKSAFEVALYHLAYAPPGGGGLRGAETILRAALLYAQGDLDRALSLLADPLGPAHHPLERWRHASRVFFSRLSVHPDRRRIHAEALRWARARGDRETRMLACAWRSWCRYQDHRFRDAARLQREAASLSKSRTGRCNLWLQAGAASLEAGEFAAARRAARRGLALLRGRHPQYEARALEILRSADYREGRPIAPDLELALAGSLVEGSYVSAILPMTEAAIAWRNGDRDLARRLAILGASGWKARRYVPGERCGRALALVNGAEPDPGEPGALLEGLSTLEPPAAAAQVAALVAMAFPGWTDRARESLGSRPFPPARGGRWEYLHRDEAAKALNLGGPEPDSSL